MTPEHDRDASGTKRFPWIGAGLAFGIYIGCGLGAALGAAIQNVATGVALGVLLGGAAGVAFGAFIKSRKNVRAADGSQRESRMSARAHKPTTSDRIGLLLLVVRMIAGAAMVPLALAAFALFPMFNAPSPHWFNSAIVALGLVVFGTAAANTVIHYGSQAAHYLTRAKGSGDA